MSYYVQLINKQTNKQTKKLTNKQTKQTNVNSYLIIIQIHIIEQTFIYCSLADVVDELI